MGYTIYDGNAYDFPMWKFKTEIKLTSFDADQVKVTAGKISDLIDSLKGDALHLAQRIGVDELKAADGSGIEKLISNAVNIGLECYKVSTQITNLKTIYSEILH